MNYPLTNSELDHLLDFIGYGRLDADVWFIGMEEAGGGEDNLRRRLQFRQVEDCAEAHQILGIKKHHWGKKIIQRTWRDMCLIMLLLEGLPTDRESIRHYQADHLGRFDGNTLLCELMPIPKHDVASWGYLDLLPQFRSRADYYRVVKPNRIALFLTLIHEYRPKTVICYGKAYWEEYRSLFSELEFSRKGQFEVAYDQETIVILTDHFTSRTMNGKFGEVVNLIKGWKI